MTTVIGADQENPHDVLSINAASAALMISGIPFEGPIGAVRIAYSTDGEWLPHPTYQESDASVFELVVAGRQLDDGDVAIMMVEAGGTPKSFEFYAEGAPKVDEAVLANGLEASKQWIKESIGLQRQLVASVISTHGPITALAFTPVHDYGDDVFAAVEGAASEGLSKAVTIARKAERNVATDEVTDRTVAELAGTSTSPARSPAGSERSARPCAHSRRSLCANASSKKACASTDADCQTFDRCPQRSASCRPLTALVSSSVVRRRSSTCARWPCRA